MSTFNDFMIGHIADRNEELRRTQGELRGMTERKDAAIEACSAVAKTRDALLAERDELRKALEKACDMLDAIMYGKTVMIGPDLTELRAVLKEKP